MSIDNTDPFVPNDDTVIWRYIDDRKFADLLKPFDDHDAWKPRASDERAITRNQPPGRLWFGYPLFFDGSKEASFPDINDDPDRFVEAVLSHGNLDPEAAARFRERYFRTDNKLIREGIHIMAHLCGASCWEANSTDKPSLWSFVGGDGVAIRSTCGDVQSAMMSAMGRQLSARLTYCAVGYVDHESYYLPQDGYYGLLTIIQRKYGCEREVRFMAKSPEFAAINMRPEVDPGEQITFEKKIELQRRVIEEARAVLKVRKKTKEGFRLPIDLSTLLSEVVVKPGSSPGYEEKVRVRLAEAGCAHVPVRGV